MMNANKTRINKFDNLKGFAILLVLLGHFDFLKTLHPYGYKIIFLIDLPLFFFVSGYFSKIGPGEPLKAFKRLLIPYIIFSIIYRLFDIFILGYTEFDTIFIYPDFALWFLLALFYMKMALPIVDRAKYPLLVAIIGALVIGILKIDPKMLGVTRAFTYFPFFLVGFYYRDYKDYLMDSHPKIVDLFKKFSKLILPLAVIITIAAILFVNENFFYLKFNYGDKILYGIISTFIVICLATVWILIFNRFMTNRSCFLTKFGINSMAVYILHGLVRQYLKPIIPEVFANNEPLFVVVLFAFTFALTYILSRDIVTKYLNKLTDAVYGLIVRSDNSA